MKIQDLQNRILDQVATPEDLETLQEKLPELTPSQTNASQAPPTDSFETAEQNPLDGLTNPNPSVASGLEGIRSGAAEVRDAVVGQAKGEASRALANVVDRFQPGIDTLQSIRQQRLAVEEGVANLLKDVGSDALEELKVLEESPRTLLNAVQNLLDPETQRNIAASYVDLRNGAINSVAQVGVSAFLEHRELILGGSRAFADAYEILLPISQAVPFVSTWCMAAITASTALNLSVEVATAVDKGAGLLTRDRIDTILNNLERGQAYEFEAAMAVSLAKGLGLSLEAGASYSLRPCSSDPNRILYTVTGQTAGGIALGVGAQDQGVTLGAGVGAEVEKVFAFDISSDNDRQLLSDFLLATQSSLTPSSATAGALDDHLVRTRLQGGSAVQGQLFHSKAASGSLSSELQIIDEERAEGSVRREALVFSGDLSIGGSFGQLPQNVASELPLFEQTGGDIGLYLSLASQATIGREFVDDQFQRIVLELQFDTSTPGNQQQTSMLIAIDRPDRIPNDLLNILGSSTEAFVSDHLGPTLIRQAIEDSESSLSITMTGTSSGPFQGAAIDVQGIKLRNGISTNHTHTRAVMGNPPDLTLQPRAASQQTTVGDHLRQVPM